MELQDSKGDKRSPSMNSDDGVMSRDSGKHRQKLKWRWHWKKKDNQPPQVAQFSHDPPGHTCGLPCCIQDNEPQQALQRKSQAGCVTVPILSQADLSDSNFIMKRRHFPAGTPMDKAKLRRSDGNLACGSDEEAGVGVNAPLSIRLSKSSDAVSFDGIIGQRKDAFTNKAPDWPHHRKQRTLSPTEQIRQRHITLPDCPQTQHTIMFLNHQPGETSDFPDIRTGNYQVLKHQEILDDSTDDSLSQLNVEDETVSENNEMLAFESQSGLVSPDEGYDKGEVSQDASGQKRLVHSKLPEVPVESTDSGLAFEQDFRQVSPEMDDVEDNLSIYVDHVYDVLSDVKDRAHKLSQRSSGVTPGSTSDLLSPSSVSDFLQPRPATLHRSVSELTLSDIDSFTFPVEDNESCIYNGSLLSYATNDSDVSQIYPSVLARHRYLMGHPDYHASLLRREFFGSKLDQLSLSSTEKNENEGARQPPDNVSAVSITNNSDAQPPGIWVDLGLLKPGIKVDEYDMGARLLSRSKFGIGASVSSEFDLDSNTKLKLWDLRLSTASRELNDYSTLPLRMFPSDDVNLSYFRSRHDLLYPHSSNAAIEKMTNNLMPSSVLSNNIHRDNTALYYISQNQTCSFQRPGTAFGQPDASLNEWKHLFDTNTDSNVDSEPFSKTTTSAGNQMPGSWNFPWKEESEHEPIVFSGIYELYQSKPTAQSSTGDINGSSKCVEYTRPREQPAETQLTENRITPNPTIAFDQDNSVYASYTYFGGSVSCSTSSFGSFAQRSTACGSVSSRSKVNNRSGTPGSGRTGGSRQSPSSVFTRTSPKQDKETVIMTKGHIVDWRRQAEVYRDNNFITLIL